MSTVNANATAASPALRRRPWVPAPSEDYVQRLAASTAGTPGPALLGRLDELVAENHRIHDIETVNLNPATNVMNPRAEAVLAAHLGSRASLGYPGDKYETGLEAIEQIEVLAAELVAEVFGAGYAEVRVPSGAIANLYAFIATTDPGDTIVAPPASLGGHVTHHAGGSAGMYRLRTVPAPVRPERYSVDLDALRALAREARPRLITVGGSLNLLPHPVSAVREIADEVGALVLFDAAHVCGLVAGGAWPNPLDQGAHLMTFSTYKSLGGPAGGAVVTRDARLAERLDAIAFPGLTANFDAARTAALAVTMVDWRVAGADYAEAMVATASALADELAAQGLPVFTTEEGHTRSHALAVEAARWGGGQAAARTLRRANLLACGIGLPVAEIDGDMNGLRLGTPEIVRRGAGPGDMPALASLVARALGDDATDADLAHLAAEVTSWRAAFGESVLFTAGLTT